MQLQPVILNVDPLNSASNSQMDQSSVSMPGNTGDSPFVKLLEGAQEIFRSQDQRIADDLDTHAKSRTPTAKMLSLLQLQYDLDDMQYSATLTKNIANQFSQALTTLTQRS